MIVLLEAVGQVLWIEVITLLIRLINSSITLIVRMRQLDEILFVNIRSILSIFAVIKGRLLKIIINYRKSGPVTAIDSAVVVVADVLVQKALFKLINHQLLILLLVGDEGLVA